MMNGVKSKMYRGMASFGAQRDMGKDEMNIIEEGVSSYKKYTGPTSKIIRALKLGLGGAFSYSGAHNMAEFKTNAKLIDVTAASYVEGTPHGA